MALSSIVKLFRLVGCPEIVSGKVSASASFSKDIVTLIKIIQGQSTNIFKEILIDNNEIFASDDFPENGSTIEFIFQLPSSDAQRFYESIFDFIKTCRQASRGDLPEKFYLIDHDYLHGEDDPFEEIIKLEKICQLIKGLSEIAPYHEQRCIDHLKLIFVHPGGETKPTNGVFELNTKITQEMLTVNTLDISIVDALTKGTPEKNPHYNLQKGIFGASLSEFVSQKYRAEDSFSYLILNWNNFLLLYQKNLETFLSGFAFHKAKKEVAEEEIKIADQLSKIINDIIGKMLGIPISFAAIVALTKSSNLTESVIITLGLLLAAIVLSGTISNQQNQLKRIIHAKNLIIKSIEIKKDTYPEELKNQVEEMSCNLDSNQKKLISILWTFRILSWLPIIISEILIVYYHTNWLSFLLKK